MTDRERERYEREYKPAYNALMRYYPLTLDDLDGEQWADISGYDKYLVSNFGRVKSFQRYCEGRIVKPQLSHKGYLSIELRRNGVRKVVLCHQLVAQAFIPNVEGKPEINHVDGHKLNCHVSNLEWATRIENLKHAVKEGLVATGEGNYQAALTNEQARFIRDNPEGLTIQELAVKFGIDPRKISQIQLGQTYSDAGGKIRKSLRTRLPDSVRSQIKREYKRNVRGYGARSLAKKYGVDPQTILKIVHEED